MQRKVYAAVAIVALSVASAPASECRGRMEAIAADYGDFFTSRNAVFLNNQPVLRDLRNAAVRLQAQGLEEACANVVSAMEAAIAAYRAEGEQAEGDRANADTQSAGAVKPVNAAGGSRKAETAAASPDMQAEGSGEPAPRAPMVADPGKTAAVPERLSGQNTVRGDAGRADLEARAVSFTGSDVLRDTTQVDGADVYNFDNERLGNAQGLLLRNGRPTHLVVDHGGFWNFGQRRIAIPVEFVRWDPTLENFLVPLTTDQLGDAPKYDGKDKTWTAQANDGFYADLGN